MKSVVILVLVSMLRYAVLHCDTLWYAMIRPAYQPWLDEASAELSVPTFSSAKLVGCVA